MAMTQTYLKERLLQKFNFDEWKELLDKIFSQEKDFEVVKKN